MSRYKHISKIKNKRFISVGTSYLPKFEEKNSDLLLISVQGDRCDLLSHEYYGTPTLWWFIASVNNLKSNNINPGIQLRIPVSTEQAKLK